MRLNKSVILAFLFFSLGWIFQPDVNAQRIDKRFYRYPYKNPYLATATVGLLQGSESPPTSEIKDLRVKVLDDRNDVYLLEGKGALRYRFYQQNGPAPLVFIVPGLAGSAYTGSARFLAEWLASNGFHALILPSRFNWNFTLAASASGYPGSIQEDSQDLYSVMRLVLDAVKIHCHAQIGKIGVLGLSDGALNTAYISETDPQQRHIGIDAYLLVNPPVDLFEAARKIDRMVAIGKEYGTEQRTYLEAYGFGVLAGALRNDIGDPDYFAGWNERLRLKDRQIEYLIGKSMHDAIGDTLYVIDLAGHSSILKTPISWGHRSDRLAEARSLGLLGYAETFLIPRLKGIGHKETDLKFLNDINSIRRIESELEKNQSVFLMHNLDDILVSVEDITYLEKIFGDRATVYPHGGHLGNLWYLDNKNHILEVFKPLLQSPKRIFGK